MIDVPKEPGLGSVLGISLSLSQSHKCSHHAGIWVLVIRSDLGSGLPGSVTNPVFANPLLVQFDPPVNIGLWVNRTPYKGVIGDFQDFIESAATQTCCNYKVAGRGERFRSISSNGAFSPAHAQMPRRHHLDKKKLFFSAANSPTISLVSNLRYANLSSM